MVDIIPERIRDKSLRDFFYVVFRHKWKAAIAFFVVTGVITGVTIARDQVFRAEAKLLVRLGRESVTLDPTVTTGQVINVSQPRRAELNSELEILRSRELIEGVVDNLGAGVFLGVDADEGEGPGLLAQLTGQLDDRERALLKVSKNLSIEVLPESNILAISYEAHSPQLARRVVSKFIELFLEKHIAVHRTPGSYQFFSDQSDHLRDRLRNLENELQNVKTETGLSAIEEERRVLLNRVGVLEQQHNETHAALNFSRAKAEALKKILSDLPQTVLLERMSGLPNEGFDRMREHFYELQLQEHEVASRYGDNSRLMEDIRRQVEQAKAILDSETSERTRSTHGLNAAHQQIQVAFLTEQSVLASHEVKVDTLKEQIGDARKALSRLNAEEVRIDRLRREIDLGETNYRKYSENLEQARIDQALETGKISNIRVVQGATASIEPVRPRRLLTLIAGLCLGVFCGIGLAFFSEYFDHTIKTPEDVEDKLQLPILASIRYLPSQSVLAVRSGDRSQTETRWDFDPRFRDDYLAFRERLIVSSRKPSESCSVVAVTGSRQGAGVTTVATNLAALLAGDVNGSVLLVDADLRHARIHQIFGENRSPGLADDLATGANALSAKASEVPNLHFLTAGGSNGSDGSAFATGGFADLLWVMRNQYRYVVIDLPAVIDSSSAPNLASMCDAVVFVVETEVARWQSAQKSKSLLAESNANVVGVVLNKRRYHIPEWLYRAL